ncbi:HdeD family acid-resistance protein [Streptomyces sp. NPDC057382]|uniref:HdeD family acid-resistance protein n=1 Tax=unclassified Streptomyces TaxID=2593676 RepID=UPI003630D87D
MTMSSPGPAPGSSAAPEPRAGEVRRERSAGEPAGHAPGPDRPADPADLLAALGRSWTWILASAAATLVPGVLLLVWPEATLHVVAVLIGLYLLASGVFRFVEIFARQEQGHRAAGLLLAVLYVLAGVLCLRNPLQTITALSLIVGLMWLVSGMLTLYTALAARDLPHRGFLLGAAVLAVVAGVVVLALPAESARALTRLLGLWLVLLGLAEAGLALAWRAALRRAAAAVPGGPGTGG